MDYTQSNSFVTDAGTAQRMHLAGQAVPTAVSDNDMNQVIWELMEIQKAGGQVAAPFDKATPATYQKLLLALRAAGVFTTPPQFDNSTRAATALFVRTFGASFSGVPTISAAGTLPNTAVGGNVKLAGATYTSTLPLASAVPAGGRISIHVTATGAITLARAGADTITPPVGAAVTSLALAGGDTLELTSDGVSAWVITGGALAASYAAVFGGVKASAGYQRLPGGLIFQWLPVTTTVFSNGFNLATLPIAFPNAHLANLISSANAAVGIFGSEAISSTQVRFTNSAATAQSGTCFSIGF